MNTHGGCSPLAAVAIFCSSKFEATQAFARFGTISAPYAGASLIATSLRILVTGSSGFLGAHLVRSLVSSHLRERVFACDIQPASGFLPPSVTALSLDIRDAAACLRLFREVRPTHILHAAAVTHADNPALLHEVNVSGTCHLLDAAIACGSVSRFVLTSSSAVYGACRDMHPCDENHPLDLRSAYAESKFRAEQALALCEAHSGIITLAARVGPCYGFDERVGKYRTHLSMIGILSDALHANRPLRIAGTDTSRDWTHVGDVAAALSMLLTAPALSHRIYNVSAGVAFSARTVIAAFVALGLKVEWIMPSDLAFGPEPDLTLCEEDSRKPLLIERLRADVGFTPAIPLEAGIQTLAHVTTSFRAVPEPGQPATSELPRPRLLDNPH